MAYTPGWKPSVEEDPDALGNLQPELPGDPDRGDFGITDACSQRAEAAINSAVGIRADDEIARQDMARLHQHKVRDARVDIVELRHAVVAGEVSRGLLIGGVFFGFGGGDMIQHDGQTVGIVELRRPDSLHYAGGAPRRGVTHHKVGISLDDLSRRYRSFPGFRRKNLLGDGHSHLCLPERAYVVIVTCHFLKTDMTPFLAWIRRR